MGALLAYLEVDSADAAADLISEDIEPDAYILEDGEGFVLQAGRHGLTLVFPMSVDDFWELVRDLENEVVSQQREDLF